MALSIRKCNTAMPPSAELSAARVSAKRRASSGGNVIIESAFTLLPTFALLFAMIDFGLMIFRWSTLQNAVREGCRYAITFQTQSGLGQDNSIQNIVESNALGFVKRSDSPQHIFVDYYTTAALNTPIGSGGNVPGNLVEVTVKNISYGWLAPLSGSLWGGATYSNTAFGLKATSADILGGYPAGTTSVTR